MTQMKTDLRRLMKIISKISIFCVLSGLVYVSCTHEGKESKILILGEIKHASGTIFFLEQNTFELQKIDSAHLTNAGTFQFEVVAQEMSIYAILLHSEQQMVFIALPGDTIVITGDLNHFPGSIQINGNEETVLLQSFYAFSNENRRKVDSLQSIVEQHQNDPGFYQLTLHLDSAFTEIWEEQRAYEKTFIRDHPGTLAALLVVNYHFGVRSVLSPDTDFVDYNKVDSGLMATYPDNKHTQFFHRWLEEVK